MTSDVLQIDPQRATARWTERCNPVIAYVWRGSGDETWHRGVAVAADFRGRVLFAAGDTSQKIFPRSMSKPITAVALIESGAVPRYGLTTEHIAMAAASHFGQEFHLSILRDWADRIGVKLDQIRCGTHPPFSKQAAASLIRLGQPVSVLHNNNCGRHLAMLTIARMIGAPLDNYLAPDHPANVFCKRVSAKFLPSIDDPANAALEIDGLPTACVPMLEFATGLARLARPDGLGNATSHAASRVIEAMAAYPTLVSGENRMTSSLVTLTNGRILVKCGSEGGLAAVDRKTAVAVVVKTDDGAHAAAEITFLAVLKRLSLLTEQQFAAADKQSRRLMMTYAGDRPFAEVRTTVAADPPTSAREQGAPMPVHHRSGNQLPHVMRS
jgi:L-asparaginase II